VKPRRGRLPRSLAVRILVIASLVIVASGCSGADEPAGVALSIRLTEGPGPQGEETGEPIAGRVTVVELDGPGTWHVGVPRSGRDDFKLPPGRYVVTSAQGAPDVPCSDQIVDHSETKPAVVDLNCLTL
jgi:hypothetical protein